MIEVAPRKTWLINPKLESHPHIACVDGEHYECLCGSSCDASMWDYWIVMHVVCRSKLPAHRSLLTKEEA